MGESGRKNVCKLHTTLSSETPLPPLRRSPFTFYGIAATGSYGRFNSLRDAPPAGEG